METHEVVISGMSGRFPNCESVEELSEFLINKVNLVSEEGRWEAGELNVPHQVGKISDPYVFDLTYFGIHRKLGEYMDPNVKLVLENSIAAIHDAGLSLDDVTGLDVATIVGSSLVETEYEVIINNHRMDQTILSHSVCMQANRLAYYLDLKGPSYVCDSGWNGAMSALRHARNLIARGQINAALVSASSLLFLPQVSYHYDRLGRLNADGKTKCFSNDADGYSRAEASVVFFLQRKEDALRNYGTIIGVDVNQNGSKDGSIADCASFNSKVLTRIYEEKKIDPSSIAYLEASGCASKIVDAQELNMVSEVFLKNRVEPLLIGSAKSNMGHTEAASGFVGIVKAIISAEKDIIPPNLHYSGPNKLVPALASGQLQVVTEPTPLKGDIMAVNNISALGGFAHAIIEKNKKCKKRVCQVGVLPPDGLPRIVLLSGRELNSLNDILDKAEKMPIDEEFVALSHRAFGRGVKRHMYRGYTILHDVKTTQKFRQVKEFAGGEPRPLWFVFAGMGSQWPGMAADLMQLPTFAKAIHYCHSLLEPFGMDLINIVTNPHPDIFKNIHHCFVGIAAVQVGLVDLLREVGLEPDGLVGHSLGELGCAYCDGTFSAKQMIMGAYYRGKISADSGISDGLMAAVGKGYQFMKNKVPPSIDIACRNSDSSCTISGPIPDVQAYIEQLSQEGVFVRSVACGNIAYHSRYIQKLGPAFLEALKKLVPNPKPRSPKWISSSVPKENWGTDAAMYSSAEYHTNNLLSPVLFEEAIAHIPKDAIILEVAPRGLLQAIIRRAIPSATYIPLAVKDENGHMHVMASFGKLYNEGIFVNVEKLYPPVEFPVSRGTPSLANFFTWIHHESWRNYAFLQKKKDIFTVKDIFFNNAEESKYNVFADYKIYNNAIIPASVYIETIIDIIHKIAKDPVTNVKLENIDFKKVLKYGETTPVRVALQEGSGLWEFCVEKTKVASGRIQEIPFEKQCDKLKPIHKPSETLNSKEVYLYLDEMGLQVNEQFKLINSLSISEDATSTAAEILWNGDWLTFMDALFVFLSFGYSYYKNKLHLVKRITQIFIDFNLFSLDENTVVKVVYNKTIGLLWSDGLEIHIPVMQEINIEAANDKRREFHVPKYVSFQKTERKPEEFSGFLELCTKIILQNLPKRKLQVFSLSESLDRQEEFCSVFKKNFDPKELQVTPLPDDGALLFAQNIHLQNSYILIINEGTTLVNTLKTLSTAKGGYLLCRNVESSSSLACITSCKFGTDTYFIYKTVHENKKNPISVVISSPDWKEELKNKLAAAKNRIVYVAGYCTNLNYVHEVVQWCSLLENSEFLRYVFMETVCDSFNPEEFKEVLSKDVRINILKNGNWGTYIFSPVELPLSLTQNSVYQFRNIIKVNGIHIHALGLNMAGMMKEGRELGVFEYSGVRDGKSVCGLASLNDRTTTLELDPVFEWNKPALWSHEEASSILLSYAIAYRLLIQECSSNPEQIKRVLVLNGELPLSQAIIRLALLKGCTVFTTYDNVFSKKAAIKELFPEIPDQNILVADKRLDSTLLMRTNGKGMHVVVNTSSNTDLLVPAMNALGMYSKFFQVSSKETEPGITIGMRIFLQKVCWHGIGPEILLNLAKQEKDDLWKLVDAGLNNGEIRLIKTQTLPSTTFNMEAMSQMNDDYVLNQKFIVVTNDSYSKSESVGKLFLCSTEKLYIILGNENILWFDLIQWLMSRGGRKFTIMVNNISPLLAKRLTVLLAQKESIQINLYSTKKLHSVEQAQNFISQTEENVKIGGIFVFGKEFYNVMGGMLQYLNGTRVVFIGEDVDIKLNGKPTSPNPLSIKIPNNHNDFGVILQNLDSLMNAPESVIYMKEFSANFPEIDKSHMSHWQHLPDSAQSIAYLSKSSGTPVWKELRTSSPRLAQSRGVSPVFILPPLRKGQLDRLIHALFHPAFAAVIPPHIQCLQDLSEELAKDLDRFDCGVFTIICADWSYNLGLALGKILERNGKIVSLILLDVDTDWADIVLKSVYEKAKKTMSTDITNERSNSNKLLTEFQKGCDILKNRVELACSKPSRDHSFKGLCHVFTRQKSKKELNKISEHCERPIKIHSLQSEDFLEIMDSPDTARIINTITLVENKDSAYPVSRDYEPFKLIVSPVTQHD